MSQFVSPSPQSETLVLDAIDKQILRILQTHADISNLDLAQQVNLSATPCARRVKRLEQAGYILQRICLLDRHKLGLSLSAFVAIGLDRHTQERFEEFETQVATFDEVVSCSVITGRDEDYLLKVVVRDMAHYEQFLLSKLNKIAGVTQVHTSFEMRQIIPVPDLPIY